METLKEMNNPRRSEVMYFSNGRSSVVGTMVIYYNDNQQPMICYEICVHVDGILHRAYYNIFSRKERAKIFHKSVKNVLKIKTAELDLEKPF